MITVQLGAGVSKITIPAIIHISNLIMDAQRENGYTFGKVVVNYNELTFYKLMLKVGRIRYEISDLACTPSGIIDYVGPFSPTVNDIQLYKAVERANY